MAKKTYKMPKEVKPKQKKVVLFTTPSCKWCNTAKQHLKKHNISFKVVDITKDHQAAHDCERRGCRGVPAYLIGTQFVCGFDQKKVEKLLNI